MHLCLLGLRGGLLLLLSSRPADLAERRELGLLDPVGTTSKATVKEVGSRAGRAPGSGSSTVAEATRVAEVAAGPVGPVLPPAGPLGPAGATPAASAGPATQPADPDNAGPADLLPAAFTVQANEKLARREALAVAERLRQP